MTGPIRIAIIGGGMGGLTLANALVHRPLSDQILAHHPGFEVHVYEARPEFSKRSAFVGLGINAKKALKYCVPDAVDMLRQSGGVHKISSLLLIVGAVGCDGSSTLTWRIGLGRQCRSRSPQIRACIGLG